jgi:hypothetical protein
MYEHCRDSYNTILAKTVTSSDFIINFCYVTDTSFLSFLS